MEKEETDVGDENDNVKEDDYGNVKMQYESQTPFGRRSAPCKP